MTRRRSRSVRTSLVTALFAVSAIVGGCGNDFDALFADQASPAGPIDAGDSGRPSTDGSDVPEAALACGAPTACAPQNICADKSCTNTCTGCGCTCPAFECSRDELETCVTTCGAGSTCSATCTAEQDCALVAHGATAKLACEGRMDRCTLTCDQGASCELTCALGGRGDRCIAVCDATSSCLVDCGEDGPCNVDCQGGQKRTCPQPGVFTCNRDCPK